MAKGGGRSLVDLLVAILEIVWLGGFILGIKRFLDNKSLTGFVICVLNIIFSGIFGIIDVILWVLNGKLLFGTHL